MSATPRPPLPIVSRPWGPAWVLSVALAALGSAPTPAGAAVSWNVFPTLPAGSFDSRILDPLRDRMLVLAGGAVWSLGLGESPGWLRLENAGVAPDSAFHGPAIYDPLRDRMVVVGGEPDPAGGEELVPAVWALTLSGAPRWSRLAPVGLGPHRLSDHPTAVYDSRRDRILVYGRATSGVVWTLTIGDPPEWGAIEAAGPGPGNRTHHLAIYDPSRDRMVLHGGIEWLGQTGYYRDDTWALSLGDAPAWSPIPTTGTPPPGTAAFHDGALDRMWVVGEGSWAGSLAFADGQWQTSELQAPAPSTSGPSAVFDSARRRIVAYGGVRDGCPASETWSLDLDRAIWARLEPANQAPGGRSDSFALIDTARDRMLVLGPTPGFDEVRVMALDGSATWSVLHPAGAAPASGQPVLDAVRERVLIWTGSQLWSLDLAVPTWSPLEVEGGGPVGGLALVDPARDWLLVFDGGLWELPLAGPPAWRSLAAADAPPADALALMLDPDRDRAIAYYGFDRPVWALGLARLEWTDLGVPSGYDGAEQRRRRQAIAFDPASDRVLAFGGEASIPDPWHGVRCLDALALDGAPEWRALAASGTPHAGEFGVALAYDAARGRLIAFGGTSEDPGCAWGSVTAADLGETTSPLPVAVPKGPLAIQRLWPNPARGELRMDFTVADRGPVGIGLLDVAGRVVAATTWLPASAGRQTMSLDIARGLPPGTYFVRLASAGRSCARRAIVVR